MAVPWPPTVALPGSVSHGTLRTEDLIPTFAKLVREIDPVLFVESKDWCPKCLIAEINGEPGSHSFGLRSDDDRDSVLQCLFDALEELAPDGYYFGAHEGDGSDFGFWESERYNDEPREI